MTKPGYLTTEFWTTLLTQALALVAFLHPGFDASQWQPQASALAILAAAVASGVYALGRSHVKAAALLPAPPAPVAAGGAAPEVTVPPVTPPAADPAPAPPVVPTTPAPIMPPAA
jgi:hypothetical protein